MANIHTMPVSKKCLMNSRVVPLEHLIGIDNIGTYHGEMKARDQFPVLL